MSNTEILHKNQYIYLWRISWLAFCSGLFSVYRGHQWYIVVCPFGVWITSINYWRKPDYSWRRYLDIGYVHCAVLNHIYYAYYSQYKYHYYFLLFIGILYYQLGCYYYSKNNYEFSTICHGRLHIYANLANMVLYCSDIL